eukprot:521819_1
MATSQESQVDSPSKKDASSPYVYDRRPGFTRDQSVLDIKSIGANTTFYGNLVISCSGHAPCFSKFSKLLLTISQNVGPAFQLDAHKDDAKSSPEWTDDNRMTIRGALWTKSEKLRIYFISLLEQTQLNDKYPELYHKLCDEKYKISDDKTDFILNTFVHMVHNNDSQLLQCLANFKCTQQSRPLWDELQDNIVDNDLLNDQQAILDKVDEVRSSPMYQDMSSKGIDLDDNEILAIYIYTSNDEFADLMQKHLKIPCKWKQTFYYFVRGVLKIYDCKVYGAPTESLPSDLFHPVFLSFDVDQGVQCPLPLLTTINCTSSKEAAKDFAPPDGSMFVIKNCAEALSKGELIAAPINWISPHPAEDEWVVLPCTFIECSKPHDYVHNAQLIEVTKCKSISPQFLGVDIYTKLSNLQFIRDINPVKQPRSLVYGDDDMRMVVHDIGYYKHQCVRLQDEVYRLKETISSASIDSKQDDIEGTKKEIKIPFKKIEDEAYCITDECTNSSMCVVSCNGELNPPFISSKGIEWLQQHFESNELDIFVDTYAKCGTTVGIKMVYKILEAHNRVSAGSNAEKLNDPWNAVPWIEVDVSQQLLRNKSPNDFLSFIEHSNKLKTPRIWKTHAPFVNFPCAKVGKQTKIIHIIRNPKDVVCSYFDFFRKEPLVAYRGSFDTLFDWFCDGSVVHSSIFEFELNWDRALKDGTLSKGQLLIISYEDIVRKPKQIIERVSKFLGYEMSKEQIEGVADAIDFDRSKKEAAKSSDIAAIVNKGKIGRWKDILTKHQSNKIDRIIKAKLRDAQIPFVFE